MTQPAPTDPRWGEPTAAGCWFTSTGDWVRLPSGAIYSTQVTTVAEPFRSEAPKLGVTPQGYQYCVGYSEYGAIWLNYDPVTGHTPRVHWTHAHHRIVVTRRMT